MRRKFTSYSVYDSKVIKAGMLNCAEQFNIFCLLDNHQYDFHSPLFECLLGAGVTYSTEYKSGNAIEELNSFIQQHDDWIFGHLSYDLKNEIEILSSVNHDEIDFPELFFFVPKVVILLTRTELQIGVIDMEADEIYNAIISGTKYLQATIGVSSGKVTPNMGISDDTIESKYSPPFIKSRFSYKDYIDTVIKLKAHILRGDCYEINFCQEFYANEAEIDPAVIYQKLSALSPNPFAALYKLNDKYCICESPERYIQKIGNRLISQPMKGTAARDDKSILSDHENRNILLTSKERSENVMIVDLVRNDLAKVCKEGSVTVDELYGIYEFPLVYQMISTISGLIDEDVTLDKIVRATFPMGSMTGAPKVKVMQLIEQYEKSRRGLFSGSIGYINPSRDFDFNVVIRSILYNSSAKYLSIQVGSAITYHSNPEKEYEECQLKISAIRKVLQQ